VPEPEMKILLVEDDDIDALVLTRLLRRLDLNYPVVRAQNGEDALAILRSEANGEKLTPPFTMIVDINMPRMTGFELLDEIIDDPLLEGIPIYILTSSNSHADKNQARRYRIRGYMVKPVTEPVLLEIFGDDKAA